MGSNLNKHESKYLNTALLMNEAFIQLLEMKDYEYITIKELCQKAGVNRSTFYLHYESMDDLLVECIENLYRKLQEQYSQDFHLAEKISHSTISELYLFTKDYTIPYLNFLKENQKAFMVALNRQELFKVESTFERLYTKLFEPILSCFQVPENEKKYITKFFLNGIHAIAIEWIKNGCKEEMSFISSLIEKCVHK